MHQLQIIFLKDLRRFYPEVLVTLLATTAFACFYPYTWLSHEQVALQFAGTFIAHDSIGALPILFIALLPISWLVLIGRLVQDESLVGDSQYWVTRPFHWRILLLEKCLFLTLFLVLPFFAALLFLLHSAGFPVSANTPRTILLLLLDTFAFILPLFVLATITRNFFRLFLTILAMVAAISLVAALSNGYDNSTFIPQSDFLSFPLFIATCLTVVFVQYSSRTVWFARTFLAISLAILTVAAINPFQSRMLDYFYPTADSRHLPVELAISTDPSRTVSLSTYDKVASISVPFTVAAVPYSFQVTPENARLTVQPAHGLSHSTPWHAIYNRAYTANTRYSVITLQVDPTTLALLRGSSPVSLQLELALAVNEYGRKTRLRVPDEPQFTMPSLGICARDPELSSSPGLLCRFPLRKPPLALLSGTWTTQPCSSDSSTQQDSATLIASPGTTEPTPVDTSLTSVLVSAISFSLPASTDVNLTELPPLRLCPGSSLFLTPLILRSRARIVLTLPNFHLTESAQ